MEIKIIRSLLDLNQSEMARAMGVHIRTYTKWENGEQGITACPRRLADVLMFLKQNGMFEKYVERYTVKISPQRAK